VQYFWPGLHVGLILDDHIPFHNQGKRLPEIKAFRPYVYIPRGFVDPGTTFVSENSLSYLIPNPTHNLA